ncbi:YcnI family protein [Streptomyces sp. KLOTTS4A1]|uniref:YcnI family copper-binding membrane protein n=1 Tax=Streptomyces sp. KLOTTS4A1 TaxID=3390996 RepID=UPI0039F53008
MKISRVLTASAVAAGSIVLLAPAAFAHVTVQPQGEAAKGSYATVNFKVPNESDKASTVKLEVNFPTDQPLSSVMPQPVPGWKIEVTKSKLDKPLEIHGNKINEAVSKVTWTADGKGIEPGRFQQFPVSLGRLPEDADQMVFKALQTYSDDEIVRWIEEPVEGGEKPEKPAPVLQLAMAAEGHGGSGADKASNDGKASNADAKSGDEKQNTAAAAVGSTDTAARVLGIVGILVGAAGVAFGVLAGRRRTATGSN